MLALILGSYLHTSSAHAEDVGSISRVMGGIQIDARDNAGDLSAVNGGIDIGRGANTGDIETVNGGIDISDEAVVDSASTVNGGIDVGNHVTVRGSLETVNGGIQINSGSTIQHSVETVNGRIRLSNTQVGEYVATVNGDLILRDESVVDGDLILGGRSSWFNRFFNWSSSKSDLIIDASSTVRGDIHLYEEYNLRIDDDTRVGEIIEHF
jgi:DUF4097 and DUF4098 domain-containing protein YvlB